MSTTIGNYLSMSSSDLPASEMQLIENFIQGGENSVKEINPKYCYTILLGASSRHSAIDILKDSVQSILRRILPENLPVNIIATHLQLSESVEDHRTNSLITHRIYLKAFISALVIYTV
ncbi:hypothetical protein [Dyadobacter sp. CY356]|uniref:hypothetical protein n=1 Tax=Dyadobacter sp. CY356 TaxID=2906442 RepID=UPI001F3605B4|nr:hypothetical protein [Dyadobacter sp. CY356]MCF0055471.1 hypothetical protein [Dyadobacter sp. CY356]